MNPERRALSRLALPLKVLADRFAFGALVILSLALLAVGKANVHLLEGVSTRINDALAPALGALMQPITASRRLVEGVGELLALRAENARLKEQNLRLLEWQSAARQLTVENAALRQLDARLRLLLPLALAVGAVLIDVLPVLGLGPWGLTPFSTLCVVYFWSLYRPDLFGTSAAFATGIIYDAMAGFPLGLTALILILTRRFVVMQRRFFAARSFLVVLSCFLLLAPAAATARWLLACLWWGRPLPFQPIVLSLLLTMALYPIVSLLLARVHHQIPRLSHAP